MTPAFSSQIDIINLNRSNNLFSIQINHLQMSLFLIIYWMNIRTTARLQIYICNEEMQSLIFGGGGVLD